VIAIRTAASVDLLHVPWDRRVPAVLRASVIVPARDAEATLPRTLGMLARQDVEGEYEVIVVDDGSRDRTAEVACAAPGPVTVCRQPPLGPAAARNLGVETARATSLAFCDADVYPTAGWLQAGLDALAGADLVQGMVLPDPTAELGPFDRSIWITGESGLYEAASLFVDRKLFERIGGFQEWLRPAVGKALAEDVWLGYRARRLGARAAFCPQALAHHAVFPRNWREYVAERRRLEYFPAMVRQMPELRRRFLYRRWFLNRRTALLDLALAGTAASFLGASPVLLAAAAPYVFHARRHSMRSRPLPPRALAVGAADVAADLAGLVALASGSAKHRTPVL
jgi:glycosyltransferase involved in cell wall biosynthesis